MHTELTHVIDHFNLLVAGLSDNHKKVYETTKHARIETAFRDRIFVVYKIVGGKLEILDRLHVTDFICNEERGASTELLSTATGERIEVGYTPVQLFDYPAFVCIPLHAKVRWGVEKGDPKKGHLAFPLLLRTTSRFGLREPGIVYVETSPEFMREFKQGTLN